MYSSDIRSCREVEDTTCLQAYISNGILHIILRKIVVDDLFHQLHSLISVFKGISIGETDVDIEVTVVSGRYEGHLLLRKCIYCDKEDAD